MGQRVDLLGRIEVDAIDQVDHVPQQVAGDHAVGDAVEDGGDHVAATVAVGRLQDLEVGQQTRPTFAIGANRFVVVDEGDQFVAGDAIFVCGPIPPAVRRLDGRFVLLAADAGAFPRPSPVVEKLEEHDPGQQGSRSRSPFSPLSFRMMSRADLIRLPNCCAVVLGCSAVLAFLLAICSFSVRIGVV